MTVIDTAPLGAGSRPAPTFVHLTGEIDIFTTARLRQRLIGLLSHSPGRLVLDLSQVTFCGTGGLAVLLGVQKRARSLGIPLALTGVPPRIARLLHVTGLENRFPPL
ncbi:Anti-sigma-B factor antagonist [Nonomuraea coxensis DSM 45129]|uniref:Anti-sigma factor antagonist n=1 Tax=Nonomuraea coxensis DSM 45129 TaxID=1122611 RepID=A0ABX8U3N5_9ACTN|nr:STAS domain-containing protein [Nonomuraea coxensis]QYC42243.1 Anti-sigma-B factor antagonist [Nonomuraea coxensis DSM 45129]